MRCASVETFLPCPILFTMLMTGTIPFIVSNYLWTLIYALKYDRLLENRGFIGLAFKTSIYLNTSKPSFIDSPVSSSSRTKSPSWTKFAVSLRVCSNVEVVPLWNLPFLRVGRHQFLNITVIQIWSVIIFTIITVWWWGTWVLRDLVSCLFFSLPRKNHEEPRMGPTSTRGWSMPHLVL